MDENNKKPFVVRVHFRGKSKIIIEQARLIAFNLQISKEEYIRRAVEEMNQRHGQVLQK